MTYELDVMASFKIVGHLNLIDVDRSGRDFFIVYFGEIFKWNIGDLNFQQIIMQFIFYQNDPVYY